MHKMLIYIFNLFITQNINIRHVLIALCVFTFAFVPCF